MRRPRLTDATFFAFTFSPKKNPKPVGLRKTHLSGLKGRRKARVNAFNKMPAEKQEVIRRSGLLEGYLKGEVTYTDSKRVLRQKAVDAGVVKPLHNRQQPQQKVIKTSRLNAAVINHLIDLDLDVNVPETFKRLMKMPDAVKPPVIKATRAEIRRRASEGQYAVEVDDELYNPYWYH